MPFYDTLPATHGLAQLPNQHAFSFVRYHCPNRVNYLRAQQHSAMAKLRTGPVIIGETHSTCDARAVVCDMIEAGAVRKLFLEISNMHITGSPDVGRLLLNNVGKDIKNNSVWKNTYKQYFDVLASKWNNPISFRAMIEFAVPRGVKVYLYDNYKNINVRPTTNLGVTNRNKSMAALVQYANDMTGAVLLVGHAHAQPSGTNNTENMNHRSVSYNNTLQAQLNIPFYRVIKLSPGPWKPV